MPYTTHAPSPRTTLTHTSVDPHSATLRRKKRVMTPRVLEPNEEQLQLQKAGKFRMVGLGQEPEFVHVWYSDETDLDPSSGIPTARYGSLYWAPADAPIARSIARRLPLHKITDLYTGVHTAGLQQHHKRVRVGLKAARACVCVCVDAGLRVPLSPQTRLTPNPQENCCVAAVSKVGSLELEAESPQEAAAWLSNVAAVLKQRRSNK